MPKIPRNDVDRHIGARLRRRRNDLDISMRTLASALEISYQQIQKYERGTSKIAASLLYEIAYQLQVPIEWFFAESGKRH